MDILATCFLDRGYQVGPRLGSGFYAEVYQVTELATGVRRAAKVYLDEPPKRAAAAREVGAFAALSHPRLPSLAEWFEVGEWMVLVMDLVPGANVRDEVDAAGPLPVASVVEMGIELCDVLGHIAAQGWTYRDLHVKNIHRNTPRGAMLVDLDGARPPGWPGQPSGRSGYRAPELERSLAVTPACDMYSLAGCLFFALTGDDPPDRLGRIPGLARRLGSAGLAGLLNACRLIDAAARPTAEELAAALRQFAPT
jgi:serine/threonine protein kinase